MKKNEFDNSIEKARLYDLLGTELTKVKIFDYSNSPRSGLKPKDASAINNKAVYGKVLYGLGLNKIPDTVQFGRNIIVLKTI